MAVGRALYGPMTARGLYVLMAAGAAGVLYGSTSAAAAEAEAPDTLKTVEAESLDTLMTRCASVPRTVETAARNLGIRTARLSVTAREVARMTTPERSSEPG